MGLSLPYHRLDLSLWRSHFLKSLSIPCYRSGGDDPHHHDNVTHLLQCCIHGLLDELRQIELSKRNFPISVTFLNYVINWLRDEENKYREEAEEKCRDNEGPGFNANSDGCRLTEVESDHPDKKDWLQLWGYSFIPSPPPSPPPSKPSTSWPMDLPRITPDDRLTPDNHTLFKSGKDDENYHENPGSRETDITAPTKWIHTPCGKRSGSDSDSTTVGVGNSRTFSSAIKTGIPYLSVRKQRRCWSKELHQKFTDALFKLGGSRVATPKQIRELMGVDGLTNDEVKSHLQKYRLHLHRSPSHKSSNEISPGQVLHRDITSKAGISNSLSPDSPLLFTMASTTCNTSGEISMVEGQATVWRRIKGESVMM